jgi:hypothetical protein
MMAPVRSSDRTGQDKRTILMLQFIQYYGKYQSLRGNLGSMPFLGRLIITLLALPGLALLLAAILLFGIGLLVLGVLTIPIYRLIQKIRGLTHRPSHAEQAGFTVTDIADAADVPINPAPRRQVDVRIVE